MLEKGKTPAKEKWHKLARHVQIDYEQWQNISLLSILKSFNEPFIKCISEK